MSPELELELARYLREMAAERGRGLTLESLHHAIGTLTSAISEHEREDTRRFDQAAADDRSHRMRLETLESAVSELKDDRRDLRDEIRDLKRAIGDMGRAIGDLERTIKAEVREVKDDIEEVTGNHQIPPHDPPGDDRSVRGSWRIRLPKGPSLIWWIASLAGAGSAGALLRHLLGLGH